jgi:hypothetical protein
MYVWRELLRTGRYIHQLMTTTHLRCHILPRILATTRHSLLQLAPSKGMTRHHTCLITHSLLQLIPSKGMTRRHMCLTSHNLLWLVPRKGMMRCHSLLNNCSQHMNNECLLKKVLLEKLRTCLNGKFKTRFPKR